MKDKVMFLLAVAFSLVINSTILAANSLILSQKDFKSEIFSTSFNSENGFVVATQEEVVYINKEGLSCRQFPLQKNQFAVLSENGGTFAVVTYSPGVKELVEKTEFMDSNGKLLFSIDEGGYPYLAPDSSWFAVANSAKNQISFLDKNGKVTNKHNFSDIKGLKISFSADARYCLANVPNMGKGKTSGFLVLFSSNGKKLWKFDHPGSTTGYVVLSQKADKVIFASESNIYCLNKKGRLLWRKSIESGGIAVGLSKNGKFLVVGRRQDNSLSLYDVSSGKVFKKKQLAGLLNYNSPFTSLSVSDEGLVLATAAKSWSLRNKESYLYLLKGDKILYSGSYSQRQIKAKFSSDSQKILMTGEKGMIVYDTNRIIKGGQQ